MPNSDSKTQQTSNQKRALISVSDKTQVVEFAQSLVDLGFEIISSGGTYNTLQKASVPATEVKQVTGFPEILDGRVKTLHPNIHGGILSRGETDTQTLEKHNIQPIDLVVVNLYPFKETIAKPQVQLSDAIENIDIGGPAMIRAAAKNHQRVAVVVEPKDYNNLIETMQAHQGAIPLSQRQTLAAKAFAHTASYDAAICGYLSKESLNEESLNEENTQPGKSNESSAPDLPQHLVLPLDKAQTMRYGENPHQTAAFYRYAETNHPNTLASAIMLQGKPLSYNNIADADAALETVKSFDAPACVIVKHANPCGVAVRPTLHEAYLAAYATDPTSAFGGIIAFNKPLDAATAQQILSQQFVEVVIAPAVSNEALAHFKNKPNIRVLNIGEWDNTQSESKTDQTAPPRLELKTVSGGVLVQSADTWVQPIDTFQVVSEQQPSEEQLKDLAFAWKVVKFVKSNAIVYAKAEQTVGIGAGQMSRVYSARIASIKAEDEGLKVPGCVMASDAFFPFRDTIDNAAKAGITAIIQPGGSKRDPEVIDAANEHKIAMVFTNTRHFRH